MADQTQLLINAVDRTPYVKPGATSIRATLGAVSTMQVELFDEQNALTVVAGQSIDLTDGQTKIFSGVVDRVIETFPSYDPLSVAKKIKLKCVDWGYLAGRRLVTTHYAADTAGDIVKDLVDKYLSNDGVTDTRVEDGITVGPLYFNFRSLSSCLDRIAKLCGFHWYIDYDKDMVFAPRNADAAPRSITNSARNYARLRVERGRRDYRNVQVVLGGDDLFEEAVRTFVGDGERTTFSLDYPCGDTPTITVDGVPQTVGIRGEGLEDENSGINWFWRKGEKEISQNTSDGTLTGSDTLRVSYNPLMPITIMTRSSTAIADRVAVEGGSGIYESVKSETQIEDEEVALSIAEAWIRKYARINTELTVTTYDTGYLPGQLQSVVLTTEGLNDEFLITSVAIKERGLGQFVTEYKAIDNEVQGGWPEYFKMMAATASEQKTRIGDAVTPITQGAANIAVDHTENTGVGDFQGDIYSDPYTNGMIGNDCFVGYIYTDENVTYVSGSIFGESPPVLSAKAGRVDTGWTALEATAS